MTSGAPISRARELSAREAFRDVLFLLLRDASAGPARSPSAHAAHALRQFFIEAPLVFAWQLVPRRTGTPLAQDAARVDDLDAEPVGLSATEIGRLVRRVRALVGPTPARATATVEEDGDGWTLTFRRAVSDEVEERWALRIEAPPDPDASERRAWFATYRQGQDELASTVGALRVADRQAELERLVDGLAARPVGEPFEARLAAAVGILDRLHVGGAPAIRPRDAALAVRVGERVVHEALGSGWLDRPARSPRPVLAAVQALRRVADASLDLDAATRLRLFARALSGASPARAPAGVDGPGNGAPADLAAEIRAGLAVDPSLALMVAWSVAGPALEAGDAGPWASAAAWTHATLGAVLAGDGDRLDLPRLALWFAASLLGPLGVGPGAESATESSARRDRRSAQVRAALALREALRGLWGERHRVDVATPADALDEALDEALIDLVAFHVHHVLGLPTVDVVGALRGLATGRDGPLPLGRRYVRHVLEVYLAGQLAWTVDGGWPRTRGLAALADLPAPDRALRAAYALAALHHDVGVLLLARVGGEAPWPSTPPTLGLPDPVRAAIGGRRDEDVAWLVEVAQAELRGAGLLSDGELAGPSGALVEHGHLGAWALVRNVHRSADGRVDPTVLRHATRAVLAHADVRARVDPVSEPVAAVLIAMDQLFAWEPPGAWGGGSAVGRAGQVRWPGLRVVMADDGPRARVDADRGVDWMVDLDHPDRSGAPTWQVWLSLAQNLGRIGDAVGVPAVRVRVTAPIPAEMVARGLTTATWIEARAWSDADALGALAPTLRTWVAERRRFSHDVVGRRESVDLHPLVHPRDVRLDLPVLCALFDPDAVGVR